MSAPAAWVVAVGDELLLGRTVDTNSAWLGGRLAQLGIPLQGVRVVPDEAGEIRAALEEGMRRATLLLVTGGLGPTPDDLTRDVAAELTGRALREDPELLRQLTLRFQARGFAELPASNLRTVLVPEGAEVLPNPRGTVPGLLLREGQAAMVLLPGVPREMKGIVEEELVPRIPGLFPDGVTPLGIRVIPTTGIPESLLTTRIQEVLPSVPPPGSLAYLPRLTGVELRLTVAEAAPGGAGWLDRMEEILSPVVSEYRIPREDGDLAAAVVEQLRTQGARLSVGESCTGGGVSARITDVPGASEVFPGGVVAYCNEVKVQLLNVAPELLERHGAVSREVCLAMARGARQRFGSEYGVGVTGVAGPGGGSPDKPVGTVWLGVVGPEGERCHMERLAGGREEVRIRAVQAALFLTLRLLQNRSGPGG